MMRNKIFCMLLCAAMLSALLTGCGSNGQNSVSEQTEVTQGTASDGTEENIQSSDGSESEAVPGESIQTNGGEQDPFTESMAEAGKSVVDALDGNILYVSVMNHLSIDCDCDGNPAEPDMHDMGILASADPVALDQACVDLIYASQDDTESLIGRMESRNAVHVLEHGEEIGLGSRSYHLVSIDE